MEELDKTSLKILQDELKGYEGKVTRNETELDIKPYNIKEIMQDVSAIGIKVSNVKSTVEDLVKRIKKIEEELRVVIWK